MTGIDRKAADRQPRWLPMLVSSLLLAVPAAAFHQRGVANCSGCHVMHEGADILTIGLVDGILTGPSASDVCLSCHADAAGSVLGSDPLAPPPELGAGNFVFLLEDNLNDAHDGGSSPIPGDAAGHNVVAPGAGLTPDVRHSVAPGGSFPADQLGCTSCHDPHGRETFRFLYGVGAVQGGIASFAYPAPEAEGISLDGGPETTDHHTAYRGGMSDWCANCHGRFHDEVSPDLEHPSDEILDFEIIEQYNVYNGDDDPTGGVGATAYLPEVPFEDPGSASGSQAGAGNQSRVMCLSCHRAHATSAPAAGRWDFNVALLIDDGVVSGSWAIPDPYASPNQGTLCTKCHQGGPPE